MFQLVPEISSAAGALTDCGQSWILGHGTASGLANHFELHLTGRPLSSGLLSMFTALWVEPMGDLCFVCAVTTEMVFSHFPKLLQGANFLLVLRREPVVKDKVPLHLIPTAYCLAEVYKESRHEEVQVGAERRSRAGSCSIDVGQGLSVTAYVSWFHWNTSAVQHLDGCCQLCANTDALTAL